MFYTVESRIDAPGHVVADLGSHLASSLPQDGGGFIAIPAFEVAEIVDHDAQLGKGAI